MTRPTILDNRGRRVPFTGPSAGRSDRRPSASRSAARWPAALFAVAGPGSVILALFMAGIAAAFVPVRPRAAAGLLIAAGLILALGALRRRAGARAGLSRLAAGRLAGGRCGACGGELPKTPDPDGCTTCPRCTAAWRLAGAGPDAQVPPGP